MQRQSLSHEASHQQSQTNVQDAGQAAAALMMQSNSCGKVETVTSNQSSTPVRQPGEEGALSNSNNSSPLKVGNINIYNMPKNADEMLKRSRGHQVSQMSLTNNNPAHSPNLNYFIIDHLQPSASQDQDQTSGSASLFAAQRHLSQNKDPNHNSASKLTILSRNQSVANILEQVIKRLENLKSWI